MDKSIRYHQEEIKMNKKFRVLLSAFLSVAIVTSSMPLTAVADSFGNYAGSAFTVDAAESTAEETVSAPAAANPMLSIIEARKNASAEDIAALKKKIADGEANGSCGASATWSIDNSLTLTVSGSGAMTGYTSSNYYLNAPWQEYAPVVTKIVIGDEITSIGTYDFSGFVAVTSLTIGKGVSSVDGGAFYGCTALANLSFSSSNTLTNIGDGAFYDCTPLKSLSLPTTVTAIGAEAFAGCKAITSVNVPAGVTALNKKVFYGCESLKTVTLNSGVTSIEENAFGACIGLESIALPETLTNIGEEAFNGCSSLTTVNGNSTLVFPKNVATIGERAFANCNAIQSVIFAVVDEDGEITASSNISNIAKEAFSGCVGLTNLVIVGTAEEPAVIGDSAFAKTTNLKGVTLENVSSIGKSGFYQSGIQSIALNEGLVTINDSAFESTSLTSVKFPSTVADVKQKAFQNCLRLESVSFADNAAVSFAGNVFNGCISLKTLNLEGVKVYGQEMFKGCTALTEVTLSKTAIAEEKDEKTGRVTAVTQGQKVFSGCTALKKVNAPEGVKVLCPQMFLDCPITEFTIPSTVVLSRAAFMDHKDLKKVVSNAEALGSDVFSDCENLTDVTLNNTKFLGGSATDDPYTAADKKGNAFACCTNLESITLPETLVFIYPGCFQDCFGLTEITIPDSIDQLQSGLFENCKNLSKVEYSDDVVLFGDELFKDCVALKEIKVPDTLCVIGYNAFSGCTGITSMIIPEGVTEIEKETFSGCTSLRAVFLKGDVTSIGNKAFYNCGNLNNYEGLQIAVDNDWQPFSIPSAVTNIGSEAFSGCTYLDCEIPAGVTTLGDKAFYNCENLGKTAAVALPLGITKIGTGTFYNCKNLPNVAIGSNVTTIGGSAFYGCCSEKFTRITIPAAATQIGSSAFEGCTNLETVTILSGTKNLTLGVKAFYNCENLSSVTLPTNLTSIGANAFENCKKLEGVLISSGVTSLGNAAFKGCSSLKTAALSATQIKTLGNEVFSGCSSLTMVELPDSVTSIGSSAFEGCSSLAAVTIPGGVTTLNNSAFKDCVLLESIVIPVGVKSFGSQTFKGCPALTAAIVLSVNTCKTKPFDGADNVTIYCYEGAGIADYAADNEIPYEYLEGSNGSYLVVLKQPKDVTDIKFGETAEFSVKVATEGTPTYTWYYKLPGSTSYTEAPGANSDKYSVVLNEDNNGIKVYCKIESVSSIDESKVNTVETEEVVAVHLPAPSIKSAEVAVDSITLTWSEIDTAESYEVYRADSANGEKTKLGTSTTTSYRDTTVEGNTQYYYFVVAVDSDTEAGSEYSAAYAVKSAEGKIESFVERLYTKLLGRASDATGKANHVKNLKNGKTAAEVSKSFVLGTELAGKKLSNEEFVKRMYSTFLNRTPSAKEVTRWATTLDNGCSYAYVFSKFVASAEFKKLCSDYGITPGTYTVTESRDKNENITAFVSRMYTTLLGRSYDVTGLNNNTAILIKSGTAADVGKKFVLGTELANKKLSNSEFVKRMYQTFLNRTPSSGEITRWATTLDNGCSYGYILKKFVASTEFKNLCAKYGINAGTYTTTENRDHNENITAFVSRMYTKALGRKYDIKGLNSNTGRLIKGEMTAAEVAEYFILSAEFENRKLTDEQFVTTLYSALFNRNPDATGKAKWLAKLKAGTSRKEVLKGFTSATEFKNLVKSFGL